jgi:hypothetical protein
MGQVETHRLGEQKDDEKVESDLEHLETLGFQEGIAEVDGEGGAEEAEHEQLIHPGLPVGVAPRL